ncbi:MAG: cell wall-binding repeat-containing protein [Aeromicrobium sp.]|nr:cell wall-binding repeat-containing protein [Aeromicrobium sp.]
MPTHEGGRGFEYECPEICLHAGLASFGYVGVATGENYPDALAGGIGAGVQGGVVALTASSRLSTATKSTLEDHAPGILYVDVFGGTTAVAPAVRTAIEAALGW